MKADGRTQRMDLARILNELPTAARKALAAKLVSPFRPVDVSLIRLKVGKVPTSLFAQGFRRLVTATRSICGLAVVVLALLVAAGPVPALADQPPSTMNYQGYLTDSSGTPLNGSYNLVFRLYDDVSTGTVEWGPETHNSVTVSKGIFQVELGSSVTMYPNDFDEALFLEIQVNGETMAPRQPLRAAAYAFGLVPGAEIEGEPSSGNYALRVDNTGTGTTDRGLYAKGEQYGIYAEEVGADSDVGIYSPDFVHAQGFRSDSDSYLFVPGTAAMLYPSSGCELYSQWHGSVRLECSTSGYKYIDIPVTVPGVLYGQNVRIQEVRVYYDLDNAGSYIDETYLRRTTGAAASDSLIYDSTDRTSTAATSYSLSPTDNNTLDSSSGPLNLNLRISHDGNTGHDVNIGMIRVRLRHYEL